MRQPLPHTSGPSLAAIVCADDTADDARSTDVHGRSTGFALSSQRFRKWKLSQAGAADEPGKTARKLPEPCHR